MAVGRVECKNKYLENRSRFRILIAMSKALTSLGARPPRQGNLWTVSTTYSIFGTHDKHNLQSDISVFVSLPIEIYIQWTNLNNGNMKDVYRVHLVQFSVAIQWPHRGGAQRREAQKNFFKQIKETSSLSFSCAKGVPP